MLYRCSKKLVGFLHFIVVWFKRLLIISAVLSIGTAMLSAYSLINFVNSMAAAFKLNPGAGSAVLIMLVAVPAVSYVLEKGLSTYLHQK